MLILKQLSDELKTIDGNSCISWKTKTTSYIERFFGKDSPQYSYITEYNFTQFGLGSAEFQVNQARPFFASFITDCTSVLNDLGVRKKEWKHFFLTTHPGLFWSIFTVIVGVSFWLGTIVGKAANKGNDAADNQTSTKNEDRVQRFSPLTASHLLGSGSYPVLSFFDTLPLDSSVQNSIAILLQRRIGILCLKPI